jgi:glycine cleavage system H protein
MVALFVIATFLILLTIDYFVQRSSAKVEAVHRPEQASERFLIPRGYFFAPKHSWVELLGNGKTRVGVDDFIQKIVGPIDTISIAPLHAVVKKGEPILTITQGHRKLSFTAPLSGKIVEINDALTASPSILNADPYVRGWVAVIEPENLGKDIKGMTIAEEAARWLKDEIARFREFLKSRAPQPELAGATMLDGGVPVAGALRGAGDEAWEAFQDEFLKPSET